MAETVLITGASGGLGLEFARIFASRGYNLILAAMSLDKLQAIAAELSGNKSIHVDVIQAREGNGKHLQVGAGIQKVLAQRDVALDDNLRTLGTTFQFIEILVAVGIDDHLVTSFLQTFASRFDLLYFQAQRLQKDDFHFAAIISISTKAFLGSSFTAKAARAG